MIVYQKIFYYALKLQKQAHNQGVKPRSYAFVNKVWLKSKYVRAKRKQKLETKFFEPFRVLHPVSKQAYKLKFFEQ